MGLDKVFEETVLGKMNKSKKQRGHVATPVSDCLDFEERVAHSLLKFDSLKKADSRANIIQIDNGYDIRLSGSYLSFDLAGILSQDNPGIELKFDEDAVGFEPDDEMVFRSKMPLWAIKPVSNNRVIITRMWATA